MNTLLLLCSGASLGATARWLLSLWLNPLFSQIALGTWLANCLGSLLIGVLIGVFVSFPAVSAEWRLFLITGFLGSFTTFSSFSGEVIEKLMSDKWLNGLGVISAHLLGALLCTALGIYLWRLLH
ncbi:camphor resistance protein CrcB [Pasteurella testudinis DSM 23072]|uniref:Fluoride-specific ion channel FluC n=1 Tax=Pasteurella testudinis DSM 23072 TaxID=1122938 RepID=A0A1W1VC37_9PAST|nr:fluoride efflux transporter CrcB [Pasteurella testudinis]SMB90621.1 camphor resistance protein CrcB [Pasteurella testudinis DSM 23072]SUB52845.1 camphor resistance protein CrcB [Pasteurella testudinis]